MRAWFYPGDNFGQEFTYPKNLRQIAVVTARSTVAPKAPEVTQTASAQEPAPAPALNQEPAREEQKETAQAEAKEEPVVVAQNTPPAPAADQSADQIPTETPSELPKTATPYPLIGLGGLLSLALYALARIKASA
jgi:hypothetical protein